MPKVRIRDNMRLEPNEYRIKIADMPVAVNELEPNLLLAIDSGMTTGTVDGIETKDPAFGADARWISPNRQDQAEMLGYTVVEPGAVLATHLTEVCRRHADEILTRDATKHLVDELKATTPTVVDELIPSVLQLGRSARRTASSAARASADSPTQRRFLKRSATTPPRTKDPVLLTEYVRHRLAGRFAPAIAMRTTNCM